MSFEDEFTLEDEGDYVDVEGTVRALEEAWKCVPKVSLSELLDMVTPASFVQLSNDELISSLNEFILQNQ